MGGGVFEPADLPARYCLGERPLYAFRVCWGGMLLPLSPPYQPAFGPSVQHFSLEFWPLGRGEATRRLEQMMKHAKEGDELVLTVHTLGWVEGVLYEGTGSRVPRAWQVSRR